MKQKLLRCWTYARRGHNTYLAFLVSMANFIVIQYKLLIQHVALLKTFFTNLTLFAVAFALTYIPLTVLIGWLDYKKYAMPTDMALMAKASPYNRDIAKALILIARGKNDEAIEILRKWAE